MNIAICGITSMHDVSGRHVYSRRDSILYIAVAYLSFSLAKCPKTSRHVHATVDLHFWQGLSQLVVAVDRQVNNNQHTTTGNLA